MNCFYWPGKEISNLPYVRVDKFRSNYSNRSPRTASLTGNFKLEIVRWNNLEIENVQQ